MSSGVAVNGGSRAHNVLVRAAMEQEQSVTAEAAEPAEPDARPGIIS